MWHSSAIFLWFQVFISGKNIESPVLVAPLVEVFTLEISHGSIALSSGVLVRQSKSWNAYRFSPFRIPADRNKSQIHLVGGFNPSRIFRVTDPSCPCLTQPGTKTQTFLGGRATPILFNALAPYYESNWIISPSFGVNIKNLWVATT